MKRLLTLFLSFILTGCVTTQIKYVDKIVYVPVTIDQNLFKLDDVTKPPTEDKFVFIKPKNQVEMITLLKGQRDLLSDYSKDLLKDVGICRARIVSIKELHDLQLEIMNKKEN